MINSRQIVWYFELFNTSTSNNVTNSCIAVTESLLLVEPLLFLLWQTTFLHWNVVENAYDCDLFSKKQKCFDANKAVKVWINWRKSDYLKSTCSF